MVDTTMAEETRIITPATRTVTPAINTVTLVTLTVTRTPLMETQDTVLHILPMHPAESTRTMSPNPSSSSTSVEQPWMLAIWHQRFTAPTLRNINTFFKAH